ncbi:MAG: glutamate formimidoyltransferase [Candidatus Bipolaricaulota bacterium]|nr:glutamate formimidoyltransferase [Candidatus Bipolaricaulota bacterium]
MMWDKLIECVPNISEGRRREVAESIASAASGSGRKMIDLSMDPDHNRSVITIVGQPEGLLEGVLALTKKASELIDLRKHRGEHPRMGAVDVIPFIPVRGVTMDDCISLSRRVGERIAAELHIPVYLYEESATVESWRNLATIRKGEFEGFAEKITRPEWRPNFGIAKIHPKAGVVAVGAREFLIAYNIDLATSDLSVAKKIARAVRFSSGGLRYVKALGFPLAERGIVQVSMNLTNFKKTPILRVFELVKREAERRGVMVIGSEIVGTVPRAALYDVAQMALHVRGFSDDLVLEERIEDALSEDR